MPLWCTHFRWLILPKFRPLNIIKLRNMVLYFLHIKQRPPRFTIYTTYEVHYLYVFGKIVVTVEVAMLLQHRLMIYPKTCDSISKLLKYSHANMPTKPDSFSVPYIVPKLKRVEESICNLTQGYSIDFG